MPAKDGTNRGRKKGSKNLTTIQKEEVLRAFQQRVYLHADKLFGAQMKLAVGSQKVFRVDTYTDENNRIKKEHVLVTDPEEIKALLDEHEGGDGEVDNKYYYFQEVPPDNRALDSLLNRGFGKPKESVDVTSNGEAIQATFNIRT